MSLAPSLEADSISKFHLHPSRTEANFCIKHCNLLLPTCRLRVRAGFGFGGVMSHVSLTCPSLKIALFFGEFLEARNGRSEHCQPRCEGVGDTDVDRRSGA